MNESSPQIEVPQRGRLFGIDYGTKRVGVAVCDPGQSIASPLTVLQYPVAKPAGLEACCRDAAALASEYEVVGLVIGLPVHMSGDEGEKAREARSFGRSLCEVLELPAVYHDERYTSAAAEDALMGAGLTKRQRKARIDMLAAQMILQSWLDGDRSGAAPGAL